MSKQKDSSTQSQLKSIMPNNIPDSVLKKLSGNTELADALVKKSQERIDKFDRVNIVVMGKTGVGKSTLINNLFREKLAETGTGKPVTQHLRKISKEGMPLTLYDTKGLELSSQVQEDITNEIFDFIDQKRDTDQAIQLVYYAIHAQSNRIEETEIELIHQLAEKVPVIIVLTQAIGDQSKEFESYIDDLNLPVAAICRVMAEPYQINKDVTIDRFGLDNLVEQSFEAIPGNFHDAFNNVQQANIKRKVRAARNWTVGYIATTFGVGFTPIPFADSSALVPLQITMLGHITAIFGINLDKATIVSLIAAVGGTGSATYVGKSIVSNALKAIPGVGTIVGGLISGATAATITSALAFSYIEVLAIMSQAEASGEDLDTKQLKKLMQDRFAKRMTRKSNQVDFENLEVEPEESKISKTKNFLKQLPGKFKNRSSKND